MRKSFRIAIIIGQVLGQTLLLCAALAAQETISVETGKIKGAVQAGVLSFKGIPYAAPPVGDLRWRPPQPAAKWAGVRDATAFGHDCM